MAAPVSRDSVLTAISVAPTSSVVSPAPLSNGGAFQGELKQATQAKESPVQARKEMASKPVESRETSSKSTQKAESEAAELSGKEAAQSAELVRSQAEERADQAREEEGVTGSSQAAITPEDLASSDKVALGNTLPSPGEALPLDQLAESIAAAAKASADAAQSQAGTVQNAVPTAPVQPTTPVQPLDPQLQAQQATPAAATQQAATVLPTTVVASPKAEPVKEVPVTQPAPVQSQVSLPQQTELTAKTVEPAPLANQTPAAPVATTQAPAQGAQSAISASDTNQVLQQQAQQLPQSQVTTAPAVEAQPAQVPVAAGAEGGSKEGVVLTAQPAAVRPAVNPTAQAAEAAVIAEESTARVEPPVVAKEPAAQAMSKASVEAAPTTAAAAAVQTARSQEVVADAKPVRQDPPQPVRPSGVGETTLSINAAPAPVAPQAVTANLQGQQSEALNMNLQQLRAGIDISAQSAAEDAAGDTAETTKSVRASTAETVQHLNSMQNSLRTTSPVQLQLPMGVPPGSQNWGRAVADKVMIAASQNLRVANIHLDPPELGALQVRLQVNGDQQVNISFTSPTGSVRDALEQQMPRLREMLEEQGINLGQSDVNDQQDSRGDAEQGEGSGGYALNGEGEAEQAGAMVQRNLSLVDYYA